MDDRKQAVALGGADASRRGRRLRGCRLLCGNRQRDHGGREKGRCCAYACSDDRILHWTLIATVCRRGDGLWDTLARCSAAVRRGSPRLPAVTKRRQNMCWPPLMLIFAPVTKPASSLARYATSPAISSGFPNRPIGICGMIFESSTSLGIAITILVPM